MLEEAGLCPRHPLDRLQPQEHCTSDGLEKICSRNGTPYRIQLWVVGRRV